MPNGPVVQNVLGDLDDIVVLDLKDLPEPLLRLEMHRREEVLQSCTEGFRATVKDLLLDGRLRYLWSVPHAIAPIYFEDLQDASTREFSPFEQYLNTEYANIVEGFNTLPLEAEQSIRQELAEFLVLACEVNKVLSLETAYEIFKQVVYARAMRRRLGDTEYERLDEVGDAAIQVSQEVSFVDTHFIPLIRRYLRFFRDFESGGFYAAFYAQFEQDEGFHTEEDCHDDEEYFEYDD